MAVLNNINFDKNRISVNFDITREEYKVFQEDKDFLLVPISALDMTLVTGTLGNSNRIMLPNKILKQHAINELVKKIPYKIIKTKKGKYLVIQLEGSEHIPKFDSVNV